MNVVRESTGVEQYRILEGFWESQLLSKQWIIDTINKNNMPMYGSVYIFGGWFGILGGMLLDSYKHIDKVISVDIDSNMESIGKKMNPDVHFVTCDMQNFVFEERPSLVINTSTEHISQTTFESWLEKIPKFVPIILQGNNYFSCEEHIRCSIGLDDFKQMNHLDSIKYEGELDCKQFTRYMTIGYRL